MSDSRFVTTSKVVVVVGAQALHPAAVAAATDRATLIAADGGLDHALAAGLDPDLLVGDLDSVSDEALAWAQDNATVEAFDPDKDHTDTELALRAAADLNPEHLVLVSGGGDRLDHALAVVGALGHRSLTSIPVIEAWWGSQRFRILHGPDRISIDSLESGSTISLLAAHGACEGVGITGVKWPLDGFELTPLSGLGISNVVESSPVEITVVRNILTIAFAPS